MNGKRGLKSLKKSLNRFHLIGLDTNIFIYHFAENPQFVNATSYVFALLKQSKVKGVTSAITITELLSFKTLEKILAEISNSFFSTPNLSLIDVNQTIAVEAARIRRVYGFKLADSIQLATALEAKAQTFISNDIKLKKFKELPVILLREIKI